MPNSVPSIELTRHVSDIIMTEDQQPENIPTSEAIGDSSELDEIAEELMMTDEDHEADDPLDDGLIQMSEDVTDEIENVNDEIGPPAAEDDNSVDGEVEEGSMPLCQWALGPRRSRRARGLSVIQPFEDVALLNRSVPVKPPLNAVEHVTLLQVATKGVVKGGFNQCQPGDPEGTFRESILSYYEGNDSRPLENYMTGFLLNQMSAKAGIRKHGGKAIEALLT